MSTTATVVEQVTVGGATLTFSNTYTEDGYICLDPVIATGQTDLEVIASCEVADISMMYFVSDQVIQVDLNDGAAAGGTFTLVANVPFIWGTNSYQTLVEMGITGADITGFFITNASGETANINIRIVHDSSQ